MFHTQWSANEAILSGQNRGGTKGLYQEIGQRFRTYGVERVLISGIPLPGRDMSKLVLHQNWGQEPLTPVQLSQIRGNDALVRRLAVAHRPVRLLSNGAETEWLANAPLYGLLKRNSGDQNGFDSLIGMHIPLEQLQILILLAGANVTISDADLCNAMSMISRDMEAMHSVKPLLPPRPGELSVREKMVLSKTAEGKTANDIAVELEISQRTVHAHLQNASEKMQAANKTQTVVEALRYAQISLA
ncbi:helix-turn-helix transcriptional regulator [Cohaesibacter sp. CAU 1516]|nr:helix-turn-helix transcriptional regulator [Cohaesibacter sp. CAU 1516]